jgi:hypothetical protein
LTPIRRPGLAIVWLTLLALNGCSSPAGWLAKSGCFVVPASTFDLPADLVLRARMKLTAGDQSVRLETVAQSVDDGLVVVGISNYGVRLFAVEQSGRELSIETVDSRNLEVIARWVMDALHRIYWIQPPAGDAGGSRREWSWAEETVIESRTPSGRRREFVRGSGDSASARVTIDYPDEAGSGVEIRNPACGYEARVIALDTAMAAQVGDPGHPAEGAPLEGVSR